jgi:hypothetical protein
VSDATSDLANRTVARSADADEPADSMDDPGYGEINAEPARTNARTLAKAGLVVSAT